MGHTPPNNLPLKRYFIAVDMRASTYAIVRPSDRGDRDHLARPQNRRRVLRDPQSAL